MLEPTCQDHGDQTKSSQETDEHTHGQHDLSVERMEELDRFLANKLGRMIAMDENRGCLLLLPLLRLLLLLPLLLRWCSNMWRNGVVLWRVDTFKLLIYSSGWIRICHRSGIAWHCRMSQALRMRYPQYKVVLLVIRCVVTWRVNFSSIKIGTWIGVIGWWIVGFASNNTIRLYSVESAVFPHSRSPHPALCPVHQWVRCIYFVRYFCCQSAHRAQIA